MCNGVSHVGLARDLSEVEWLPVELSLDDHEAVVCVDFFKFG
jgi:hypothetical protein